jgi:hypothetical protein
MHLMTSLGTLSLLASSFRIASANTYFRLSISPRDARVAGIVVLVRGREVPLVVREGEGEMKQERIVFVREAYVHGIMYGEAWEEERCKQIEIW